MKLVHAEEVIAGETFKFRKSGPQVGGESLYDSISPLGRFLLPHDAAADLPVQPDQLTVDCGHGPSPGVGDKLFEVSQNAGIVPRQGCPFGPGRTVFLHDRPFFTCSGISTRSPHAAWLDREVGDTLLVESHGGVPSPIFSAWEVTICDLMS